MEKVRRSAEGGFELVEVVIVGHAGGVERRRVQFGHLGRLVEEAWGYICYILERGWRDIKG